MTVLAGRYENTGAAPLEVVYSFPLDPDGVLRSFEARIDGRVLKSEVSEDSVIRVLLFSV
jgi:hypothetical protein